MINQDAPTTRDRLVHAALLLFAEKGYAATSIADVLRSAGVNSGSLYYFFPGKQDLLLAVLQAYRVGIGPMLLEPAWAGVSDPIARIFALLSRYRQALELSGCTYGCPIGSLALELHEPDPPVRAALAANFAAWSEAIERCLVDARHRLPADVELRALAELVLTVMEGAVMLARTHRDLGFFDRAVGELQRHVAALERAAARERPAPARADAPARARRPRTSR